MGDAAEKIKESIQESIHPCPRGSIRRIFGMRRGNRVIRLSWPSRYLRALRGHSSPFLSHSPLFTLSHSPLFRSCRPCPYEERDSLEFHRWPCPRDSASRDDRNSTRRFFHRKINGAAAKNPSYSDFHDATSQFRCRARRRTFLRRRSLSVGPPSRTN